MSKVQPWGLWLAAERLGKSFATPPPTTAHGALINHITGGHVAASFQPMNINFGLMPEPPEYYQKGMKYADKALARKHAFTSRAMADFQAWLAAA
jgi:methylenetetrahydrofolate--tRNA-(uracil-5-)-methyltransferase